MSKIYLPSHKDCGNRGCEAITEGTAEILDYDKKDIIAFSNDIIHDNESGLPEYVSLKPLPTLNIADKVAYRIIRRFTNEEYKSVIYIGHIYDRAIKMIKKHDIALSTGGDMFCYNNNEVIYINDRLRKNGVKTVLWGCSIGEENLNEIKLQTLRKFNAVIARESITKEMLCSHGIQNVYQYPDPAFVLKAEKCDLPEYMLHNEAVGINLSNFVADGYGLDTAFGKSVMSMIDHIIKNTQFHIVLIPHVFWKGQDDRIISRQIYESYKETERVHLLSTEKLNYCQIRYIISKCRFFIGARTHSMISAYSMSVPALALGYSVKSRGIAKDLGFDEKLVVDKNAVTSIDDLTNAFVYLMQSEKSIKDIYKKNLEEYISKAYGAKNVIDMIREK